VTESVERLGVVVGIYKTPFLPYTKESEYRKPIALKREPNFLIESDSSLQTYLANICKIIILE
jgi:hypothetical protein